MDERLLYPESSSDSYPGSPACKGTDVSSGNDAYSEVVRKQVKGYNI